MDRFHVEGMAEDEGDVFLGTEIGDPVPREHAFDSDYDVLTEGSNGTEKSFRLCADVLMDSDVTSGVDNTDEHVLGVQIDSAIKLVPTF
jgi:hypothetical protein